MRKRKFEYGVILNGGKTVSKGDKYKFSFEYGVILNGGKTGDCLK